MGGNYDGNSFIGVDHNPIIPFSLYTAILSKPPVNILTFYASMGVYYNK